MKLFFHYCIPGFTNCYVLGSDFPQAEDVVCEQANRELLGGERPSAETTGYETASREAIIIDPGHINETIIKSIESNEYTLRAVLITHDHRPHVQGLRTLKRIYNTEIYAINHNILGSRTNIVKDGDTLRIGPFAVEVISVPGHSSDSAVFKVERLLFTGDALSAGLVGKTLSSYGATVQNTALWSKIFSLPGDFVILPGYGPPSTLDAERRFNAGVESYERHNKQGPQFSLEIFE